MYISIYTYIYIHIYIHIGFQNAAFWSGRVDEHPIFAQVKLAALAAAPPDMLAEIQRYVSVYVCTQTI